MKNSRPIFWGIAAILAAPWLVGINRALVGVLNQLPLGISGRDIVTVAAIVLVVVLVMKDRN